LKDFLLVGQLSKTLKKTSPRLNVKEKHSCVAYFKIKREAKVNKNIQLRATDNFC
jgi:hypothetical protein